MSLGLRGLSVGQEGPGRAWSNNQTFRRKLRTRKGW